MARKGTAVKKKAKRYKVFESSSSSDEDQVAPKNDNSRQEQAPTEQAENVELSVAEAEAVESLLKLSSEPLIPVPPTHQPRQETRDGQSDHSRSVSLAHELFPESDNHASVHDTLTRNPSTSSVSVRSLFEALGSANEPAPVVRVASPTPSVILPSIEDPVTPPSRVKKNPKPKSVSKTGPKSPDTPPPEPVSKPRKMIQGGAHIPPNQQRHMRACMVCSIVRTTQQFMSQGCPNCDFLELVGNSDQINECTSQVFEGLISVADTTRSWVARYQRLEGYVPGVYATQVEGILPDDVLDAVQAAGINYVPRDGTETEMLGKE